MSENIEYLCDHCYEKVEFSKWPIQCDLCSYWFHGKCHNLSKNQWTALGNSNRIWYCQHCSQNIFPFSQLNDNELIECLLDMSGELKELHDKCMFLEDNTDVYRNETLGKCAVNSEYITHDKLCSLSRAIKRSFGFYSFQL